MAGMRYYNQLGIGKFFSFKKDLLNIFELYLSDLSQRIVTILCDKSDKYNSKMFNKSFLKEKNLPIPSWL